MAVKFYSMKVKSEKSNLRQLIVNYRKSIKILPALGIWFLLSYGVVLGQSQLYVNLIAGDYAMKDLKGIHANLEKVYLTEINLPVTSSYIFPKSLQGALTYKYEMEKTAIGGYLNYAMTGSKLYYGDYSGFTSAEQKVRRVSMGVYGSVDIYKSIQIYGKLGGNISYLNMVFQTYLGQTRAEYENMSFNSEGLTFEPGVAWTNVYRRFTYEIHAGYEVNYQFTTRYNNNKEAYLMYNGTKARIDWSGLRFGIGIGMPI